MAGAELARGRLEVASELRAAYEDLRLLRASRAILEESRAALAEMTEVARTRYAVGAGTQADLLKMNVELAMEETRLVTLRRQEPAALSRVNAILDRPPDSPVPVGPADALPALPDLAGLETRALDAQPMLRMKQSAVARGELGVQAGAARAAARLHARRRLHGDEGRPRRLDGRC